MPQHLRNLASLIHTKLWLRLRTYAKSSSRQEHSGCTLHTDATFDDQSTTPATIETRARASGL